MLQITDLTYRIAGRILLDGITLTLPDGHHAGLIGRNGTGKSTLLKLIAGTLQADGGEISMPAGQRLGVLAQEAPDGPESLLETVLAADVERSSLLAEAETAGDPHRIGEIHARLVDIEAHRAPARAAAILAGLGFDAEAQARPCRDFSGGWRMRVALAAVLFAQPDLLLLDEPTNHLDLEATLWLEGFLKSYPHAILLVSHDRDLLNKTVEKIIHLEACKLTVYTGGYDRFEQTRAERIAQTAAAANKQAAQRAHMQAFIDRFRYKASKARQAQSRLKMLARMQPIVAVSEQATASFDFPSPEPLPPPLVVLDGVEVGYAPGKPVLRRVDLRLDIDDRIALLGANGNGKSTMIKLLAGRLQPLSGTMRRSPKLKIGYFAQHQQDELDLAATPLQLMERSNPRGHVEKHRAHLARFGLGVGKADTAVGKLSGGEKARLLFALMTREAPHILLLDEPTNHLDVDAREALVQALNEYEGAVVLVSHDPHLIGLTADRLWLVADGRCTAFEGDLEDYRRLLLEQRREKAREKDSDR
ncbi:MAG TPA: ABC-F family ATP-binding cassette domain-containing protein, partial [Verrucomicrobiae bacterium]|nr:ABC-F family ATP-binding cassette domain-containing protein [Verrucomicrobiae bacterium]